MKKLLALVMAVMMIACAMPAMAESTGDAYVFWYTFSDVYLSSVREALDSALETAGITYVDQDANATQTTQTDQISSAVASGASILIVNQCETGADGITQNIVDMASAAGIPLIFFNRSVSQEIVESYDNCVFVGTNYEEAGIMQGQMIGEYLVENYDAVDLNGDGVYELLSDSDSPVNDVLTASGSLISASSGVSTALNMGATYTLTADTLLSRGRTVIEDRTTSGSASFLSGISASQKEPESILYMVTVSYHSNSDNTEYELCYYLRLYDQLPAPSAADYLDVASDAWYYDAVDYVVSRGYLSGTTRSRFSPEEALTRAMLAQTLYQVAGRPESGISHYTDVPDDAWCYAAVSWASAAGVMSGSGSMFDPERAPARQELAVALYRFAQASDLDTEERADLSGYADADQVASWARAAVEWAVASGLLAGHSSGEDMLLSPSDTVTRAEFSAVLRTLCESVLPQ